MLISYERMFFLNCALDSTENSAENLTKNDKTSIIDGLSKLLEMFKDKDTVALKNVNKARKIDAEKDTKSLEEKDTESSEEEEEAKSKEGTGNRSKLFNNTSR